MKGVASASLPNPSLDLTLTPLTGGGLKQFQAMRDEHFAEIAAGSGAFGFARSIEASLAQHLPAKRDS